MNIIIFFCILQILNVVLSTIRSLTTIKSGKVVASLVSAIYYAYYTIVVIYTVADFPLWAKCAITFGTNLIGVYIVKFFEEKVRKDKLWLVKITVPFVDEDTVSENLYTNDISFTKIPTNGYYTVFDCYCETQKETEIVTNIAKINGGKCFATENKLI